VRTHVRRIYTKLGVNNREQLFSRISPFRIR
jgi:DNA-binding CsgD family transcriptional regulator